MRARVFLEGKKNNKGNSFDIAIVVTHCPLRSLRHRLRGSFFAVIPNKNNATKMFGYKNARFGIRNIAARVVGVPEIIFFGGRNPKYPTVDRKIR